MKRILSSLGRQLLKKQHSIENEHKCGNIVNIQKKQGLLVAFVFYTQFYLTFMLYNDQEYLLEEFN